MMKMNNSVVGVMSIMTMTAMEASCGEIYIEKSYVRNQKPIEDVVTTLITMLTILLVTSGGIVAVASYKKTDIAKLFESLWFM